MDSLNRKLADDGICIFDPVYDSMEIARINNTAEAIFNSRRQEARAYMHADEIGKSGLLPLIFSPKMRTLLFSIIPDPVLYHLHIYEIADRQTKSHIFSEDMAGWHYDPDSENGGREATHVSLFVYLTDVGAEDGPFQFIPQHPSRWLGSRTPHVSMTGKTGHTFAWNRSFYHRAAPNRGPVRRRLLKLSVQRNRFISTHLANDHFRALIDATPPGDAAIDLLLGRYQGSGPPRLSFGPLPAFHDAEPRVPLSIPDLVLAKSQLKQMARRFKQRVKHMNVKEAAYD